MKRYIVLLGMIFLMKLGLFGQDELGFDHLTMEDGFTSNKANAVIQDKKGFIWIGTWNGLNQYDGYTCKTYSPNIQDSNSISSREVVELLEDRKGNIWAGTTSGLNCLDPVTGKIKRYDFKNRIISLLEDRDNQLWIGTWSDGLYKLDPHSGETQHFLEGEIISDIHEDSSGLLWIASYQGLVRYNKKNGDFFRFLPDETKNSMSHTIVTQIVGSEGNELWIGTWGGGINKVTISNSGDILHFTHYQMHKGSGSLSANVIYKLFNDDFNNLWIGTWNDGLNLLKPDQQSIAPEHAKFLNYRNEPNNHSSISGNGISSIYVDRTGVLWVGASTIDRTMIIDTGIKRYKTNQFETVASREIIRAITGTRDRLWIGTNTSIKLYDLFNGDFKQIGSYPNPTYRFGQTSFTASSVLSLAADENGLWVGTEDAGLVHYPIGDDRLIKTSAPVYYNHLTNPAIPGNKISTLVLSGKNPGAIWIGTMYDGFAKLSFIRGKAEVESYGAGNGEEFCSDNNIRTIFEDRDGIVWIGTQYGLNRFDPGTGKFRKFFYSISEPNSINDNVINSIYQDISGTIWIGTNSGLNKVVLGAKADGLDEIQFKTYPSIHSLSNEIITNILEDESKRLWIRQYRGLIQFDTETEMVVNEYYTSYYENTQSERNSSVKLFDSQLILGTSAGFLSFYPDSLFKNSIPPKVCITDLLIFNESLSSGKVVENRYGLSNTIPYTESVRLSYKDKMLTFVFSAMDYKNPKKNSYYYLLEGFDKKWNEIGARNTATYTNIPHGKYTFKVKAKNSDGVWSEEEASVRIKIAPPWWKSTLAYLFYIVLVSALLYFFKEYSFIKAREKSNLLFEKLRNEELSRLNELKSNFFTDITHELKTPLTLILGPARELIADKSLGEYASKQAVTIKNSAYKLLRMVNQLMEFKKIEQGIISEVFARRCDITALVNEVYLSYKPMAESRKIDFKLNFGQSTVIAFFDTDKIEKILYNLVSNAFKYSRDGDQIMISTYVEKSNEESLLIIDVEDTGIGIAAEFQEKVFERFFQVNQIRTQSTGGIGLFLAKALAEKHQGKLELKSEAGKGSRFRLILPLNLTETADGKPFIPENFDADDITDISGLKDLPENVNPTEIVNLKNAPLILLVEDDTDLNDFLVSGLSSEFNVIKAFNGREGLEMARSHDPEIIITDIMMPEMDGFELCRTIRKEFATSHIPIVFLTAKTMQEDEIKGLRLGAVDYIFKPFNLVSLKLKIQNILQNKRNIHKRIRTEQILQPESIELSSLDEVFLKNAVDSVNKYLDDPVFDVELFSRDLGVSSNQVYRKIKALTGQTAKEFIRNQRLKIAADLILQHKRTISEVIYMVGFTSPSYFSRCFKEFYGCTPKEYIEQNGIRNQ
jgi:signal transduction histidine kinase/ligand-binding sensor domain-containing protein/AraC-like DNA-binding protein